MAGKARFAIRAKTGALLWGMAWFGLSSGLRAQEVKTPTLDEILGRVEANLDRYDTHLPSLFCDEHVVSSQVERDDRGRDTITDSVFRLRRTAQRDHTAALVESHEIRLVDGKAPASQHLEGPTLLSGVFEGGLAVVSLSQAACMRYELQRSKKGRPNAPYVVRFATDLTPENSADCLLQEQSTGRVSIDPVSLQITRLEITTPRHTLIEDSTNASHGVGKREITVDYAPVVFGGETFWLPSMIAMRVTSGAGTFHAGVWSFKAGYRNYHKLEVTSRVVPRGAGSEP
jgi:hypothetical protein